MASNHPSAPFALMKLPGELRNQIYREHFNSFNVWEKNDHEAGSVLNLKPCLALLHASREVRWEAASIFYGDYIGDKTSKHVDDTRSDEHDIEEISLENLDPHHWRIDAESGEEFLRRLKAFTQSLALYKVDKVLIAVKVDNFRSRLPIRTGFPEALSQHLAPWLRTASTVSTPYDESEEMLDCVKDRVDTVWQQVVLGEPESRSISFSMKRSCGGCEMRYHFDCDSCIETLSLAGPLASVDWTDFDFAFTPRALRKGSILGEVKRYCWRNTVDIEKLFLESLSNGMAASAFMKIPQIMKHTLLSVVE